MAEETRGKPLPTPQGKKNTTKAYILEYYKNNPWARASEVADKARTTPSYVWKILSMARKPSKGIRGRNGRIFAHGKVFYEWFVMPESVSLLKAPVVNTKTGMKQIGSLRLKEPCSCQIHPNGHLIIWTHSNGWREWLVDEFTKFGWKESLSKFVVEQVRLNVSVVEVGVKPIDPGFLPSDLCLQTDWGVAIVRDNTPEKGVLELKVSVPDMYRFLGLPEIKNRLDVIEQGSMTLNQSYKTIVALLISLNRQWQERKRNGSTDEE